MVELSVTDQGPGLNLTQSERIFEPFFTTKTKGTGLGMAICQRIVEAHDGKIYVGNAADYMDQLQPVGTTIVVELPAE